MIIFSDGAASVKVVSNFVDTCRLFWKLRISLNLWAKLRGSSVC